LFRLTPKEEKKTDVREKCYLRELFLKRLIKSLSLLIRIGCSEPGSITDCKPGLRQEERGGKKEGREREKAYF